jgi:hypothetical protein
MALTPADKQRRYRERQSAPRESEPDVIERALLQDAERAERGYRRPNASPWRTSWRS